MPSKLDDNAATIEGSIASPNRSARCSSGKSRMSRNVSLAGTNSSAAKIDAAMNGPLLAELIRAVREIKRDDAIRVFLVTGAPRPDEADQTDPLRA